MTVRNVTVCVPVYVYVYVLPAGDFVCSRSTLCMVLLPLPLHVWHRGHQVLQEVKLLLQLNALLTGNQDTNTSTQTKRV